MYGKHEESRRAFTRQLGMIVAAASCSPLRSFAKQVCNALSNGIWNPLSYGAIGDGRVNDTAALQRTIDACVASGGGTVVLPPGHTFLCGSVVLQAHVELHVSGGACLLASTKRVDYREYGALLFAKDATDIHVSGTGTINGNFRAFFAPKGPDGYAVPQPFLGLYDPLYDRSHRNPPDGRPRMFLLVNCRNVQLRDFTIIDSPTWTIHPVGCDGVHITGISILNRLDVPNCDGIDIDHCRNVRIEGCNIVAGDDCLVVKTSRNFGEYGPCEGIAITNCTLESSSAGIKIEPEGPCPVRSVTVDNCTIVRSNRGISLLNRDGATVEDLLFTDMTINTKMQSIMWWGSGEAIAVSSLPRAEGGPAGHVRGVQFAHMQCRAESGIYLRGTTGAPLTDMTFSGVDLVIEKTTGIAGGFYDMRPGDTFGEVGLDRRSISGFFAADVSGLLLHDVSIHWEAGGPFQLPVYYGSALELHHCTQVSLDHVTGKAAHPGQSASVFEAVSFTDEIRENQ